MEINKENYPFSYEFTRALELYSGLATNTAYTIFKDTPVIDLLRSADENKYLFVKGLDPTCFDCLKVLGQIYNEIKNKKYFDKNRIN